MRQIHERLWRTRVEPFRIPGLSDATYERNGAFQFEQMRVICSDGEGWEHVSVSFPDRCPTWEEMAGAKELFFKPEEAVMQLHPPQSEYINNHPYCLHLWRPQEATIPLPPGWMVGIKGKGPVAPPVPAGDGGRGR